MIRDDDEELNSRTNVLLFHYLLYDNCLWQMANIPPAFYDKLNSLMIQAINCVEADIVAENPPRCWCFDSVDTRGQPSCWIVCHSQTFPENCEVYCIDRKIPGVPVGQHQLYCLPPGPASRELYRGFRIPRIFTWLLLRSCWQSLNEFDAVIDWLRAAIVMCRPDARALLLRLLSQVERTREVISTAPDNESVPVAVRETWLGWFDRMIRQLF